MNNLVTRRCFPKYSIVLYALFKIILVSSENCEKNKLFNYAIPSLPYLPDLPNPYY